MHPEQPLIAECGTLALGSHTVKRWLNLEREITGLIERFRPELIILEENFQYRNVMTHAVLNQLRGAVLLIAAARGVQVLCLDNNTTKKKILGGTKYWDDAQGKYVNVSKQMMKDRIHRLLCADGAHPEDDNAADAIAIGLTYFDIPVEPEPLARKPKPPSKRAAA